MNYEIETIETGTRLTLKGAVTVECAAELARAVRLALNETAGDLRLVIDSSVTIDAAGLQVLLAGRRSRPGLKLESASVNWTEQLGRYGCRWEADTEI
ncbi:hypothetical protein [Pelagicoccus sp. SDUM812003]|uniref:hypothetical protein n=1 Tax=Pelagicoccus sp. SDUM812003 TaxID=3041267 RepID=UPI00280DB460|nr:hypothetical protein [Pelagicoccus sp. SDUM812003]MDQ8204345.1 hypothetical protein [Pelagicoccus sp. SDUM812003]